jgi:coenzyme F420-reducing hydrogenase delta subunit
MQLINIPIKKVDEVWSLVKKNIQQALSYSGNHTDADYVYQTIKDGKFQLWVVWDESKKTVKEQYNGVVVTEIVQRKLKRSCHIFIVTGKNRQQWQHLISVLEDFALENECNNMELISRNGWEKIMNKFNYKKTHVVLEKTLTKKENK